MGNFSDGAIERLRELIQCQTVSGGQLDLIRFEEFERLHQVLEKQYPLIHGTLHKQIVGKASLLYHWLGTNRNLKPLMLMAHIDVVPIGDVNQWTHGPFSGEVDEGYIWGRGTADTKCLITAQMDAIEELLAEGFQPEQDVYLFYGHNEEIVAAGDQSGATKAMEYLRNAGITLGCVVDEGGSVISGSTMGIQQPIAVIGVSEKGSLNVSLTVKDKGGHSSTPEKTTALTRVARAAIVVEENPMPTRLLPTVAELMKTVAPYMGVLKPLLLNPNQTWPMLQKALAQRATTNAMIRTTFAVTMAQGSAQANVLPEKASMVVNCRILPGDTVETTLEYIRNLVSKEIEVEKISGKDPSPVSPTNTPLFGLIRELAKEITPNALVTPYLVMGGTDSAKFYPICEAVYRFSPFYFDEKTMTGVHSVNEKLKVDGFRAAIDFYKNLTIRYKDSYLQ